MKRRAFVLPIVLIVFSVISLICISAYYRVINIRNNTLIKEVSIQRKINKNSFEEIFKTKKFKEYINSLITKKKNLKIQLNNEEIFKNIGLNLDEYFKNQLENYRITLYISQGKKDSVFSSEEPYNLSEDIKFYEVFIHVFDKKNSENFEFRIKDNNRIENYIFDYQLRNLVKEDKKIKFQNFIIDLENKELFERVFSEENSIILAGNFRFFDYDKKIFYIDNLKFTSLLSEYVLSKYDVNIDDSINSLSISELNDFFTMNNLEECDKDEFVKILIENSKIYKEKNYNYKFLGVNVDEELIFDFEFNNNFILNILLNEKSKIVNLNTTPIITGVLVHKSIYDDMGCVVEGICFSDKENIENYTFKPYELLRCTNLYKISDNYTVERVEITDIKK